MSSIKHTTAQAVDEELNIDKARVELQVQQTHDETTTALESLKKEKANIEKRLEAMQRAATAWCEKYRQTAIQGRKMCAQLLRKTPKWFPSVFSCLSRSIGVAPCDPHLRSGPT